MECVIIQKRNPISLETSLLLPQGNEPDPVFFLVRIFCINLVMIRRKESHYNISDGFPIFWSLTEEKSLFCHCCMCYQVPPGKQKRPRAQWPLAVAHLCAQDRDSL